jgi:uncharacterized protein
VSAAGEAREPVSSPPGSRSGPEAARSVAAWALWPFWSAEERRLRGLFRLAIFGLLVALALLAVGFVVSLFGRGTVHVAALAFGLQALCVLAIALGCARWIDRRPAASLGLGARPGYLGDLGFGVALGGICMGSIAAFEGTLGWARYAPRHAGWEALLTAAPAVGSTFTIFVAVALVEEVAFRGYPFPNLRELLPRRLRPDLAVVFVVVASSIVFGLAHAENPAASPVAVAHVAFGGVFLAMGLVVQGDLAIPIGAHLGWNLFQNLLGMQVSGQTWLAEGALLRREVLGPAVWTGGEFGPEAGLEGLLAMVLGIALTLGWMRLRGYRVELHERWLTSARAVPQLLPGGDASRHGEVGG